MRPARTSRKRLGFEELESRSMLAASGFGVLAGGGFAYDSSAAAAALAPGSGGYSYALGYGGVSGGGFGNDGSGGGGFGSGALDSPTFGAARVNTSGFGFGPATGVSNIGSNSVGRPVADAGGNLGVGFNAAVGATVDFAAQFGSNSKFAASSGAFAEGGALATGASGGAQLESSAAEATTGVGQMAITNGTGTLGISSFAMPTNGFGDISGGGGMVHPGFAHGKPEADSKPSDPGADGAGGGELGGMPQ